MVVRLWYHVNDVGVQICLCIIQGVLGRCPKFRYRDSSGDYMLPVGFEGILVPLTVQDIFLGPLTNVLISQRSGLMTSGQTG